MRLWFFILFILGYQNIYSQLENAIQIKGLPTEEVYNVFADSKGYIWVGHSLGLSRYDGHSFTNFQNPDQTSLAVTNICEDLQGRIWCHNFNGQILYVADEKLNIFNKYLTKNERTFPSMVMLDSELIITSSKGLFVCNTKEMTGKYLNSASDTAYSFSLARSGNTIITFNRYSAYKYEKGKQLKKIPIAIFQDILFNNYHNGFTLAPLITKDTLYGYNNDKFYKFIEKNDSLYIVSIEQSTGMINTITKTDSSIWVNTKISSYTVNGNDNISNQNITDVIKDEYGNTWYSSLQTGLKMIPKSKGWEMVKLPFSLKNDFIRCMISKEDLVIYGTQNGKIIVLKKNKVINTFFLPLDAGSIEHLFLLKGGKILIAPSITLYYANINNKLLYKLSDNGTIKDLAVTENSLLLARSADISKVDLDTQLQELLNSSLPVIQNEKAALTKLRKFINGDIAYRIENSRCYSINYDSSSKETYGILKNGLAKISNNKATYILLNNKPIYASCFIENSGTAFIGTVSNGLLLYSKNNFSQFDITKGLFSNTILKIKQYGNQIVLIEPNCIQIWNLTDQKISTTIPVPTENAGTIFDFIKKDNFLYVTFTKSFFQFNLSNVSYATAPAYIISAHAIISNKYFYSSITLPYDDNNIQVNLSSPSYTNAEATYFMYRLRGSFDSSWKKIIGPIYNISLPSLTPGNYTVEAYTINFQNQRSPNTVSIKFIISKPWWQEWWFYLLTFMFFCFTGGLILLLRFNRVKKENQLVVDKLTLQNDLRKSLLRTLIAQMNPHFIFNAMNTIQTFVYRNDKRSVSNYLGKFSELIRKILDTSNIDSITLEEEIEILKLYIDLEKVRFEESFQIQLTVEKDLETELIKIPTMFIQPYVENAIKHGLFHKKGQKDLLINIEKDKEKQGYIKIIINDNGIGRSRSFEINNNLKSKHKSFASSAMQNRIELINQTLEKKITLNILDKPNDSGTIVIIELPILN